RVLQAPIARGLQAGADGPGFERGKVDGVALLVRLASIEDRAFEFQLRRFREGEDESAGDDSGGDVSGILQVMTEGRSRQLSSGSAMHERHRAKRRLADGRAIELQGD